MSLPYQVLDGLGDFTASDGVRIDTLQTTMGAPNVMISGAKGNTSNALVFFYYATDQRWGIYIDNHTHFLESNIVIEDLKWHHVAVMRSGAIARLYIDGNQVGNGITVITDPPDLDPNCLSVGQYESGPNMQYSWAGDIDNLCFYNRTLSVAEIQQLVGNPHSN